MRAEDARDLALCVGFEWSPEEADLLAPLVDATLAWAEEEVLAAVSEPLVAVLWENGLRGDIEKALDRSGSDLVARHREAARADLATGPGRSLVGRAVVEQAAVELAFDDLPPFHCLLCLEERLARAAAAERRDLASSAAYAVRRAAAVPAAEVRAAAGAPGIAARLATDERRLAVRGRLGRIAGFGEGSMPLLAGELRALADEPLPPAADDSVWREVVAGLVDDHVDPASN